MKHYIQSLGLVLIASLLACCSAISNLEVSKGQEGRTNTLVRLSDRNLPIIQVEQGRLKGMRYKKSEAYLGIPYAAPPKRWESPTPIAPWNSVRPALSYANACVGPFGKGDSRKIIGSEDCLYLNVWAPKRRTRTSLPVLFWIHGGGMLSGTASSYNPWKDYGLEIGDLDLYNGRDLAEKHNVIVVTFNYRIGVLGSFADSRLEASNLGLQDQIMALKWVQRNIAAFGGNTDKIMILGESAGAVSTCALLASPLAKGLFTRAAMQSHYCLSQSMTAAKEIAARQLESLPCDGDIACLKQLSAYDIASKQLETLPEGIPGITALPYAPVVDGHVLLESSRDSIRNGNWNKVPLIIGGNEAEASVAAFDLESPNSWEDLGLFIEGLPIDPEQQRTLKDFYAFPRYLTVSTGATSAFAALATDLAMTCPQRRQSQEFRQSSPYPVYRYIFRRGVAGFGGLIRIFLGAFHGAELFYLFQTMERTPLGFPLPGDYRTQEIMGEYWSTFAHQAKPRSVSSGVSWNPINASNGHTLEIGAFPSLLSDYQKVPCEALDKLYDDPSN